MTRVFAALLLTAACEAPLPCEGPSDCRGNACCFVYQYTYGGKPTAVYCTGSADACVPTVDISNITTRLCRADEDCVAGGISTSETLCCAASVLSRYARTCTNYCNRTSR